MNSKTLMYTGAQALALALIVFPEPLTTIAGIGLLRQTRRGKRSVKERRPRGATAAEHTYRIRERGTMMVSFEPIAGREGQLPPARQNRPNFKSKAKIKKDGTQKVQSQNDRSSPSGLEPEGLLKGPSRAAPPLKGRRSTY